MSDSIANPQKNFALDWPLIQSGVCPCCKSPLAMLTPEDPFSDVRPFDGFRCIGCDVWFIVSEAVFGES